ncbi:thermonuclease family protein [Peptoniphilus mikwangii]|uniref:thermonuclease family protein n=1 Tax=Peptoniphilus mikwangii TaxID=1354300 RepID=UPI000416D6DB|nr:thermonuclease family protein [Peptoniphilus mikwangii]
MKNKKIYLLLVLFLILFFQKNLLSVKIDDNVEIAVIKTVIDGDTVILENGDKIRIIGINTPEIGKKEELYGIEAKEFAEKILLNKKIYLEKDKKYFDKYGRKLRYIWLEIPEKITKGTIEEYNFSAIQLKNGFARTYTFKPNVKYLDYFKKIQKSAIKNKEGMWKEDIAKITRGNSLR